MSDERWHVWAAGFLDGEGYFGAHKNNAQSCGARITASQNVRNPLDVLVALYGGRVAWVPQSHMKRGGIWTWNIASRAEVIYCIERISPWLLVKREQALILLQIAELINPKRGRDKASVDRASIFAKQMFLATQLLEARKVLNAC